MDISLKEFELRAWARATLWHEGKIDLQQAVDVLQECAVEAGLVAALGQDDVQKIMADAFAKVRSLDDDVSLDEAWHTINAGRGVAQSTINATLFVVKQRDPERLRQWLARYTPAERAILRGLFLKMEHAA